MKQRTKRNRINKNRETNKAYKETHTTKNENKNVITQIKENKTRRNTKKTNSTHKKKQEKQNS